MTMTHTTTLKIKADRNDHTLLLNYALNKFLTLSPDITIVAKDGKLEVNRLLLCMYSPTISSEISKCSSTNSIFVPDFPVASVWILIDLLIFGFSSRVDLTADWFQNVLDIAKILQIQINKQNVQVIDSQMCFEQTDIATKTRKTSETDHSKDLKVDDATILNDRIAEVKLPSTTHENACEDSHGCENNSEDIKWEKDRTIYEVTCKDSKGEFHLDKFSGGKALCVFFGGTWMTPGIFEKMAGSKAKNYKKSLQVNGTPIKNLIAPYGVGLVVPSPKQNKSINRSLGEKITTEETYEVSNATDEVSNVSGFAEPSVQPKRSTNLNSGDDHVNSAGTQEFSDDIKLDDEDSIKVIEKDVYEVTCKESRGEFHHKKFISGGEGHCILFNGNWMTPKDFETLAGSKGKKYKETLRVNGKPLKLLIDPRGTRVATPSVERRQSRNLNNVEMTAKMVNNVEMTAKMVNDVAMTAKMGTQKLSNVVKGEKVPGDNSKHVTPRLKKQENILEKEYNRNSVSSSIGGVNMNDDTMADISNTAHTKKRKRHSNEPSSARKNKSKKIKLDVMQESSVKDGHGISEVTRSPVENDKDDYLVTSDDYTNEESNLSSSQVKIKTKAELKDYGDARTEDKSFGRSKNVDKKNKIVKEVYETNECKCECGAILKSALLLKFHQNEACETYT